MIAAVLLASIVVFFITLIPLPVDIQYTDAPPVATGIADYGEVRRYGIIVPYEISARQILAQASVYSLAAYNSFHNSSLVDLQLNSDLTVNATGGKTVYWVQNIAFFDINESYMNFNNEIWNQTRLGSVLSNSTALGTAGDRVDRLGTIASRSGFGQAYGLPFAFDFYTNASVVPEGVEVMMGFNIYGEALFGQGVYDTIYLKIPGVKSAGFKVDGFSLNPSNQYYETELVWGGPPGGESSTFTKMNSSLDLQYTTLNGTVTYPKAVWEFGRTGESAQNLQTNLINGTPIVTIGKVNFSQDYELGK